MAALIDVPASRSIIPQSQSLTCLLPFSAFCISPIVLPLSAHDFPRTAPVWFLCFLSAGFCTPPALSSSTIQLLVLTSFCRLIVLSIEALHVARYTYGHGPSCKSDPAAVSIRGPRLFRETTLTAGRNNLRHPVQTASASYGQTRHSPRQTDCRATPFLAHTPHSRQAGATIAFVGSNESPRRRLCKQQLGVRQPLLC